MRNFARVTRLASAAATIAILAACGAPFNPQSFAKIQNGMTEAEVTAILGKPTSIESGSLPILNITGTEYTYRSGNARGTIAFVNGKVVLKEATFGDKK